MTPNTKILFNLLMEVNFLSKAQALAVIRGLTGEGQAALVNDLKRKKAEIQARKGVGRSAQGETTGAAVTAPVKAKKVPYTVLLPPSMLEELKSRSELDGAPVSHHIRLAVRAYLDKKR